MKFPLLLSCGHTTRKSMSDPGCSCSNPVTHYKTDGDSPIDKALREFQGKWRDTLAAYGCMVPSGNNHGPCPVCGGKDRFRFDDKKGYGTWFCSQCDPQSGGGLLLLSRYIGKSTMETAKELIGEDTLKSIAPKRVFKVVDEDAIRKQNIEQAKKGAALMLKSAIKSSHHYMDKKGLTGEWLVNGEPIYSKEGVLPPATFLLVPVYKNGELINMQKITEDGDKRPLWGGDMQGVQHIINGKESTIAIVEGYATGVTVNLLTGLKTYVAFNTGNLKATVKQAKADHPESKLFIFGDHDEIDPKHKRRPGEYYANKAAAPFGAVVAFPSEIGDWDDYRQAHGNDDCKIAMREAIKKDMERMAPPKMVVYKMENHAIKPATEPTTAPAPEPAQQPAFGSWLGKENKSAPKKPKKPSNLPDGITLDGIDVDNPPGLAGEIVKYMKAGAPREIEGGAFSAMAIQCMAMAGSNIKGFKGCKLSLVTLTLGLSAAGKDRGQSVIKDILNDSNINVYGDIRSDKDVIRSAAYDNGKCFYIKDEAHGLLCDALDGKNKHTGGVPSTLMEMATSRLFKLSKLHMDEFETSVVGKKSRLEKTLLAKEDIKLGYNKDLEKAKITVIDKEMADLKIKIKEQDTVLDSIYNGIKNPALNLAALSTPQKLAMIINEDSIESGFLGRSLIFDCGVERVQKKNLSDFNSWMEIKEETKDVKLLHEQIKMGVGLIAQLSSEASSKSVEDDFRGLEYKTVATNEAAHLMFNIEVFYEQHEYLNHMRLGALYARLSERVMSVASILALDNVIDGNVTIEVDHVLYAFYVALRSIENLASNLRVNEAAEGETIESKLEGIKEAIVRRLTVNKNDKADGWRYKSKLKDYLKRQKYYQDISADLLKHNQDAFENSIMGLRSELKIEVEGVKVRLRK